MLELARSNKELRQATVPRLNKYIPHTPTPKQAAFLLLSDKKDILYGGEAGGGKSDALLMGALQYVDVPGYAALLLRRTYADLTKPKALMDRAHEWLANTDARWNEIEKKWTFPSGATLSFGYLDGPRDHFNYQSAEYQYIGIDEATQLRMNQMRYMFSRLRRLEGSTVPLRFRLASNPGGTSHHEIKQRYIDAATRGNRIFIPAGLNDNPYLDREAYRESLAELDPVTRAQLETGDWEIREGGRMFQRDWFKFLPEVPKGLKLFTRAWDIAGTEERKGRGENQQPAATAGVLMAYWPEREAFVVLDVRRTRAKSAEVARYIKGTADLDGSKVRILEEQEPGSSGKAVIEGRAKLLAGYVYHGKPSTGSKVTRAAPLATQAEHGNLYIVQGSWLREYVEEFELFPDGPFKDQVDATSLAFLDIAARLDDEDYEGSGTITADLVGGLGMSNTWAA